MWTYMYFVIALAYFHVGLHRQVVATDPSPTEWSARLVLPPSSLLARGTVEIFYNHRWGTVCNVNWGKAQADVVCKQLGFDFGMPYILISWATSEILLYGLDCPVGASNLTYCHPIWGSPSKSCSPVIDTAGVHCYYDTDFSLEIVTDDPNEYLRIRYGDVLGPICADGWGLAEALVACRHMGYEYGVNIVTEHAEWTTMRNVSCTGQEEKLYQCLMQPGRSSTRCRSAGVACGQLPQEGQVEVSTQYTSRGADFAEGQVRLTNGGSSYGRVEVWFNGQWGTVCDDGWDDGDASTVCQQLGYKEGTAKTRAYYGPGTGKIWLGNVECYSHNRRLRDCTYDMYYTDDLTRLSCDHDEDAGVDCSGEKVESVGFNRLFLGLGVMVCIFSVAIGVRLCVRMQQRNRIRNTRPRRAYRTSGSQSATVATTVNSNMQGGGGQVNSAYNPTHSPDDDDDVPTDRSTLPSAPLGAYPQHDQPLTPLTLTGYSDPQSYICTYPGVPVVPPAYEDVLRLPQESQLRPGARSGETHPNCDNSAPPPSYDSLYGLGQNDKEGTDG